MTGLKSASRRPARRILASWFVAVVAAALLSVLLGERIRNVLFDNWQEAKPRDLAATDVRVVLVDNASIAAVGSWPWPRYYFARLTEELAARQARVIAFDIFFSEPDRTSPESFLSFYPETSAAAASEIRKLEPMDKLFGQVIGAAPVVLAHAAVIDAADGSPVIAEAPIDGKFPPKLESWPAELAAIPEIEDAALGHGLVNVRPDGDGVTRAVPLILRASGKPRTGFALETARHALGSDRITSNATYIRVGNRTVPVDAHGRMRLHFGNFPSNRIISASDVLGNSPELKADEFAGKTVVIGLAADGSSDIAATPIRAEEWGPLIQAQAVDTILRGGWLERPRWARWVEWFVSGTTALLALGIALFNRPYRVAFALTLIAIPIACWLAFRSHGLLIDPLRPLLVGGSAALGVATSLFALARADRERLREALVQERIAAAETEGELQAARAIQLGMVPPREKLRNLDPRVDVDALLEPARSVGGDFYDAVKVDDDHLAVAIADVTGKGVPAALFMAMSKALTGSALSQVRRDPAAILASINEQLLKDYGEAMSVTMLLAIIDLGSGDVRLACAGHDHPIVVGTDGEAARIELEGGPPLSILPFDYPAEQLKLERGETLLLITDGVTEAQDSSQRLFGSERLLQAGTLSIGSASQTCRSVRDLVRDFEAGAEATDDLTVMAVRYVGA
jgi:serine phosphatase RsbU (regulator of sigma subunit)/CHASE2 domain-containing sensor protein